jgi:DNA-binding transcriptional regulator of glucitol operon
VVGHVVVLALSVTMILLGRWQLDVSNTKHFSLQNFGYALQWWAFTVCGVLLWLRVIRDARGHRGDPSDRSQRAEAIAAAAAPVAYRRYVMPQSRELPAPAQDSEQAAYNDYLARLNRTPAADEES